MIELGPPPLSPRQAYEKPPTSGLAVASLICGLLGFVLIFLTGIPAIIMGHMALSRVKASQGTLGGGGMALAGTILGYITTFLIGFIAILAGLATPAILKAKKAADRAKLVSELSIVSTDLGDYHTLNDRYPTAPEFTEVVDLPRLNSSFEGQWAYFPDTPADAHLPLLISPEIDKKAIVLWSTMEVTQEKSQRVTRMIAESEFEYFIIQSSHRP